MKREYMKPTMRVVKLQHQHIICTSPGGYGGHTLGTYRGSGEQITVDDRFTEDATYYAHWVPTAFTFAEFSSALQHVYAYALRPRGN